MEKRNKPSGYVQWNPWHGCTKISPGCKYCYVYRQDEMYGSTISSSECRKNAGFNLPLRKDRHGAWKIPSGSLVFTCFTSDFLLQDADAWREECWRMMRVRRDCLFYFFTKRIDRLAACLPPDWGEEGYENVLIGCTVEDQTRAEQRLPIFRAIPIRFRAVIVAPMLEKVDLSPWLDEKIHEVSASGESGEQARILDHDWVLDLRRQCVQKNIPFCFHQTGSHFVMNGKMYYVKRRHQIAQAQKAGIDFRMDEAGMPETAEASAVTLQEQLRFTE